MLEHDEDDRFITSSVLAGLSHNIAVDFVTTPEALFHHLATGPLPDIIILDFMLPSGSGLDVLKAIKSNDAYRHIPVLIASGSPHKDVVLECYRAGASSFFEKPSNDRDTSEKIKVVMDYWFGMAELPMQPKLNRTAANL